MLIWSSQRPVVKDRQHVVGPDGRFAATGIKSDVVQNERVAGGEAVMVRHRPRRSNSASSTVPGAEVRDVLIERAGKNCVRHH